MPSSSLWDHGCSFTVSSCNHSKRTCCQTLTPTCIQLDLQWNLPVSLRVHKTGDCCGLLVALNDCGLHKWDCDCNISATVEGHFWTDSLNHQNGHDISLTCRVEEPRRGFWPSPTAATNTTMTLASLMPPASSGSPYTNSPSSWSTLLREHMVVAVVLVLVLVLVPVLMCYLCENRKKRLHSASPSTHLSSGMRSFTLAEVQGFTCGFSQDNLIGRGGFGFVYRGVLPTREEVAVKRLEKVGSEQGEREFLNEVKMISRVHHKHVVSLVGYCTTGPEHMLVYEYMANRSLESQLRGDGRPTLNWVARLKAAVGSAKGLAYLHEDCHPKIIHCDIKAANILLDSEFEAKIADFGFAKFASESNHRDCRVVAGTPGYVAPETILSGEQTEKSDTFSFGVVLLELITGRRPVKTTDREFLVYSTRPHLTHALRVRNFDSLVDPRLENNYNPHEMARMVACAAACVRGLAQRRPRMSLIAQVLEGHQSAADLDDGTEAGPSNSNYREPTGENALYACGSSSAGPGCQTARDLEMGRIELTFRVP